MSDLQDLYQEIIIDHNSRPRNFRKPEQANRSLEGYNPLCGDKYTIYLQLEDDVVVDIGFQGSGCAISRASTSMMTESIKGKSKAEAEEIFDVFHQMIIQQPVSDSDLEKLGDVETLSGVSAFPARIKCAVLSWHTLRAVLNGQDEMVSTE